MDNQEAHIQRLLARLEALSNQQTTYQKSLNDFRVEIHKIKKELLLLQKPSEQKAVKQKPLQVAPMKVEEPIATPGVFTVKEKKKEVPKTFEKAVDKPIGTVKPPKPKKSEPTDYERLIGENLINKLGILILVIGVGIGAKYSIDNNLINPETRIILGYIVGAALLGFAFKLKPKYEKFSAVLLGGAMSILYFITYFAYSFYGLIPQALAFGLMAIFTGFTAFAATMYNRQVIALLGLIGAYAVPFLLSSGSGNYQFLFSYICVINIGVLALSYLQDWKPLNIVSFWLTWLIFGGWLFDGGTDHFWSALNFGTLFFLIFYGIAYAFRDKDNEGSNIWNISFVYANALFFYGVCFAVLPEYDNSKDLYLFSYIFVVNLGILTLSYLRNWTPLNGISFWLTWLIFAYWFFNCFGIHYFWEALLFSSLFFLMFYAIAIAFRLKNKGNINLWNVIFMSSNALFFYGFTYSLFSQFDNTKGYLGLLTLAHAILHFSVASFLFRRETDKKSLFFLVTTMTLVFLTIAIPVQLDGNWVTILWAAEAVLLLWISKNKGIPLFEKLAYSALLLAAGSLLDDWGKSYSGVAALTPILNAGFFSGFAFTAALGAFLWMNLKSDKETKILTAVTRETIVGFLSLAFTGMLYVIFFLEIEQYFQSLYYSSRQSDADISTLSDLSGYDYSILQFKAIWLLNYSMFFLSALSFFILKKVKSKAAISLNSILNVLVIFIFLTVGLQLFGALRNTYLDKTILTDKSGLFIGIRYISIVFFGVLVFATYKLSKHKSLTNSTLPINKFLEIGLALMTLTLLSSELLHWLEFSGNKDATKHHLSILWGIFALGLVFLGINKKKKHLRLLGIALFAVTLLKLFFYDIGQLGTIGKTIVFVSLGVLLLLISFLYNKYKHLIFDEDESHLAHKSAEGDFSQNDKDTTDYNSDDI